MAKEHLFDTISIVSNSLPPQFTFVESLSSQRTNTKLFKMNQMSDQALHGGSSCLSDLTAQDRHSGFRLLSVKHLSKEFCDSNFGGEDSKTSCGVLDSSAKSLETDLSSSTLYGESVDANFVPKYAKADHFGASQQTNPESALQETKLSQSHVYSDGALSPSDPNVTDYDKCCRLPINAQFITGHLHPKSFAHEVCTTSSSHATVDCIHDESVKPYSTSLLVTPGRSVGVSCSQFVPYQQCIYPQYAHEPWAHGSILNLTNSNILLSTGSLPYQHDFCQPFPKHNVVGAVSNHYMQTSCIPTQRMLSATSNTQLVTEVTSMPKLPFYVLPFVRSVNTSTERDCTNSPCNNTEWAGLKSVHKSYRLGLSQLLKHGSFSQAQGTCLHHLHSPGLPDNLSSDLGSGMGNSHLTSEVVALATASIPPLQPASRFRKARIHETVEQWSHERFSVHDCHLKAVPDWVGDLQKKSVAYEQAVNNAMNRKVRCVSCVIPTCTAQQELQNHIPAECFARSNFIDSAAVDPHLNVHPKLSVLEYPSTNRPLLLHQNRQTSNLFSFWDDGIRVHSCLRTVPRVCSNKYDENIHSENLCYMYPSYLNQPGSKQDYVPPEHFNINGNDNDKLQSYVSNHTDNPTETNTGCDSANIISSPLDPATAYLRRKNMHVTNQAEHFPALQNFVHCGDGQFPQHNSDLDSLTNTELPQSLLNHSDFVVCHRVNCNSPHHLYPQVGCPTLRLVNQVSNIAPPATPNTSYLLSNQRCRSPYAFVSCNCHLYSPRPTKPHKVQSNPVINNDDENLDHFSMAASYGADTDDVDKCNKDRLQFDPSVGIVLNPKGLSKLNNSHICSNHTTKEPDRHNAEQSFSQRMYRRSAKTPFTDLHRSRTTSELETLDDVSPFNDRNKLTNGLLEEDRSRQLSKRSSVLSDRLEARIRASMEAIRSTLVNSFRDELANVLAENLNLHIELDRLNAEVVQLRNYRKAFLALRSFVSPELFQQMCAQQDLNEQILSDNDNFKKLYPNCDQS